VFVPYDSLVISRDLDGGLSVNLMHKKVVLASLDVPNMQPNDTCHISHLEGRMEVSVEGERTAFRPQWYV
jgi:hypothetical protein